MSSVHQNRTCCCGPFRMKISKGANVIAIIGSIANICAAIFCVFMTVHLQLSYTTAIMAAVGVIFFTLFALLHLSIVFAQKRQRHKMFWPFLIAMYISLLFQYCVWLVVTALYVLVDLRFVTVAQWIVGELNNLYPDSPYKITTQNLQLLLLICLCALAAILFINAWCYFVVYFAYKRLKEKNEKMIAMQTPHQATEENPW